MARLYKKKNSKNWYMAVTVNGKQHCSSTYTSQKKLAQRVLHQRLGAVVEQRFQLPQTYVRISVREWSDTYLETVIHPNTKRRYVSSIGKINQFFKEKLSDISVQSIEDFKHFRLHNGVRSATVNRDLAVLRRMLRLAFRRKLIVNNPFNDVELLEERKQRRKAHIVTWEEERLIRQFAPSHVRAFAVVILETGLRSAQEALALKWDDVHLEQRYITIPVSKSPAGIRTVPMTKECQSELLKLKSNIGPEFSRFVFPSPKLRDMQMNESKMRNDWKETLKAAQLPYFWMYDLRHTYATRLSAAGFSDMHIARMMGHSTPKVLPTYVHMTDEFRLDATHKLETLRARLDNQIAKSDPVPTIETIH